MHFGTQYAKKTIPINTNVVFFLFFFLQKQHDTWIYWHPADCRCLHTAYFFPGPPSPLSPSALESFPEWHRSDDSTCWCLGGRAFFYHLLNQTVALLCLCEASLSVTRNDSWIRKCQVRAVRSTTKMFHHQNLAGSNKPG